MLQNHALVGSFLIFESCHTKGGFIVKEVEKLRP